MENKKLALTFFTLLTCSALFGQIIVGEEERPTQKENAQKEEIIVPKRAVDNATSLYFQTNWSNTSRTLIPNPDPLFADPLGERANEVNLNIWSFGAGFRNTLGKYLELSVGLGIVRNGEKYAFVSQDTAFNYETRYTYIGMPILLSFVYGKEVQFSIGAGVIPQFFSRYRQEQNWKTTQNVRGDNTILEKGNAEDFNPFIVSTVFNTSIRYKYSPFWSIFVSPELRVQLPSTLDKTNSFSHKAMAFGVTFGLSYQL